MLFASCKTEKIELTGSISGTVRIIAEDGNYMPNATATVSIVNTNFSVQTGTDGFYTIVGVPVGTYDISYSSEGYVTYTEQGVNIVGGDTPYLFDDIVLGQKPISVINNLRSYTYGFGSIRIAGDITPPGSEESKKNVFVYVSDQNTVSKDNYDFIGGDLTSVSDTFFIDLINLYYNYPPETDFIYLIAYTKSFDPNDYRYEYNLNYDEYYMNFTDFTISDTPSNIISIPIYNKH